MGNVVSSSNQLDHITIKTSLYPGSAPSSYKFDQIGLDIQTQHVVLARCGNWHRELSAQTKAPKKLSPAPIALTG